MEVTVRPMAPPDIDQAKEIEGEAFTTNWPQTPFKRELDNRRMTYLVACITNEDVVEEGVSPDTAPQEPCSIAFKMVNGLRRLVGQNQERSGPSEASSQVLGYVGMWFVEREAHITAIAVREGWRGYGIGELLIISSVEEARRRGADFVSLEARVSNHPAQSLYMKYGFRNVGTRKCYYTDNREDAVVMSTESINSPQYEESFNDLQQLYQQRHRKIDITLP